ncbi:hypothetical protein [Meiothermus sp. Pnk-1]|uniref:hypothetical protein n=1 Tax=Meiothermus sp. Pnk-1 TaxID=873128 RepID=UPI001F23DB34|nr:hypothetical protein [Meiothermus sp. Pnk-1]
MLIRPRAKIVALSLRMPPGEIVIRAWHDGELALSRPVEAGGEVWREVRVRERWGWRTLYDLVAESAFEEALLRGRAQFERVQEDSRVCYTWRLGKPRGVSDREVDG